MSRRHRRPSSDPVRQHGVGDLLEPGQVCAVDVADMAAVLFNELDAAAAEAVHNALEALVDLRVRPAQPHRILVLFQPAGNSQACPDS